MYVCAYICVLLGWFYMSDIMLFICSSVNKVLILSYNRYEMLNYFFHVIMQKLLSRNKIWFQMGFIAWNN